MEYQEPKLPAVSSIAWLDGWRECKPNIWSRECIDRDDSQDSADGKPDAGDDGQNQRRDPMAPDRQ